jgi:hypothetical protein
LQAEVHIDFIGLSLFWLPIWGTSSVSLARTVFCSASCIGLMSPADQPYVSFASPQLYYRGFKRAMFFKFLRGFGIRNKNGLEELSIVTKWSCLPGN